MYNMGKNLQRHTFFPQCGIHYIILGYGLHPQQYHYKWGQEVDMQQRSVRQDRKGKIII